MDYKNLKIKNVMVAGHAGSGKTSLVEALLWATKTTDRQGRVEDGNTVSDFDAEEIKTNEIFNLMGQKVAKVGKGIYIVNGKKVLFK